MKQILQNLKDGSTELAELPAPLATKGHVLIRTRNSVISPGTERMLVDFGKSNWIDKARKQPDKVQMVLEKVQTDGLLPTVEAVRAKLDTPLQLGYCNTGVVVDPSDTEFKIGQRIVSNGNHAEIVRVPKNLCASIPDNVDDESAAFTVLGAIALQGVRLVNPTIGECVVVTGLGLVGLLTVQILRANGCKVLAIDFDAIRCELASKFGAETVCLSDGADAVASAMAFSHGQGVDAVIIAASTKSNEPVHQAAQMSRKRGRVVLVGVVGLELSRADFFEKEISFQVSCSYGPGRYDSLYEDQGHDYPIGFVRWTEQRNFEAVLDLMSERKIDVSDLITHRFDFEDSVEGYKSLDDPSALGIVLNYSMPDSTAEQTPLVRDVLLTKELSELPSSIACAFIGAGNYASRTLIPAFRAGGAKLHTVVSSGGVSGAHFGKKFGFLKTSTDFSVSVTDPAIDILVIGTRHNIHAEQVVAGLENQKHIFVEKPLALSHEDLDAIERAYLQQKTPVSLMVGFNRRFSPLVVTAKNLLKAVSEPLSVVITVNAGAIPLDHWIQDREVGGGRIVGEACHFIDLARHLVGEKIVGHRSICMGQSPGVEVRDDKVVITLQFEDGSFAVVNYLANGGKAFPKERVEIFTANAVLQINNFRELRGYAWKGFKKQKLWTQDKGQGSCVKEFLQGIGSKGEAPIPFTELMEVSRATVDIAESVFLQE
ncbi:MAG: oxidoreductase [Nitrospirales bacterium]|nr:MAG: oxidoreductase [Nitrospirales bacterium]